VKARRLCEVPSQTFMNRLFWTAATSSGFVVNSPMTKWLTKNTAETIFDRLEAHGRTWKVYVMEPMPVSLTGMIHYPRLKDRLPPGPGHHRLAVGRTGVGVQRGAPPHLPDRHTAQDLGAR
jgi:Phosphoesterase family